MTATRVVLIVEDEWLIAEDFIAIVTDAGHDCAGPVNSVSSAINRVEQGGIDATLLDVSLNGEKSFPVAEHLLAVGIPFAFMTGYA